MRFLYLISNLRQVITKAFHDRSRNQKHISEYAKLFRDGQRFHTSTPASSEISSFRYDHCEEACSDMVMLFPVRTFAATSMSFAARTQRLRHSSQPSRA